MAHSNRNADRRTSRSSEEANGEIPEWNDSGVVDQSGEVCAAALGNSEHDGQLTSRDIQSIEGSQKGSKKKVKQSSRPSERASNVGDPECRRLSGFDGWRSGEKSTDGCEDVVKNRKSFWSIEPDVGRVAHGIPKRVDRIRGLGNAIVPQIAEQIGRVIKEIDDASRV